MEDVQSTAFNADMQNRLFALENGSWWFRHRGRLISFLAKQYTDTEHETVTDIGGGNGYIAKVLQDQGIRCTLLEPSPTAIDNAMARGVFSVQCGTLCETIADNSLDNALLLDVLEHIEEDTTFLKLLYQKVKHYAIITVPAYMSLWSKADVNAKHFRRYTKQELRDKVTQADFTVVRITYFYMFAYLPVFIMRHLLGATATTSRDGAKSRSQLLAKNNLSYRILQSVCSIEFALLKKTGLPFGSSVLCVVKKQET